MSLDIALRTEPCTQKISHMCGYARQWRTFHRFMRTSSLRPHNTGRVGVCGIETSCTIMLTSMLSGTIMRLPCSRLRLMRSLLV
eukprot:scaffold49162_cov48-Prasinocladus_malaysianus.AAC.1